LGGHTYTICSTTETWDSASAACTNDGKRLARVDNSAENAWLFSGATAGGLGDFWIGGDDRALEGDWHWQDGARFWPPVCAPGEALFAARCYFLNADTVLETRDQAKVTCQARGAGWDLTKIESQAENDFLFPLFSGTASGRWIGATDATTEGNWFWDDGTQFWTGGNGGVVVAGQFAFWDPGQPTTDATRNCARMRSQSTAGQWADTDCGPTGTTQPSICEGPPSPSSPYTNWASGEPNNIEGAAEGDCARILITDGTWRDSDCLLRRSYVCEEY
jgi:hypothetical protein